MEAPFQLMVSIFAMTLVIALSYFAIQHYSQERCEVEWDRELRFLASTIEKVTFGDVYTTFPVTLKLKKCGDVIKHSIRIKLQSSEEGGICMRVCGTDEEMCWVIEHKVYRRGAGWQTEGLTCIHIPESTKFQCSSRDCVDLFSRDWEVPPGTVRFKVRKEGRGVNKYITVYRVG